MDPTVAAERRVAWLAEITRYQWLVLFVAWAGWALDSADFNLFSLVLRPAVTELKECLRESGSVCTWSVAEVN